MSKSTSQMCTLLVGRTVVGASPLETQGIHLSLDDGTDAKLIAEIAPTAKGVYMRGESIGTAQHSEQPSIQCIENRRLAEYMQGRTVTIVSDDRQFGEGLTFTMSDGRVIKITAQHNADNSVALPPLLCYESMTTAEQPGTISLRRAVSNKPHALVFQYPELCTTTTEQVDTFISWLNAQKELPHTITWVHRKKKPGIKLRLNDTSVKLDPGDYVVIKPGLPHLGRADYVYVMSPEAFAERYTIIGPARTPTP